MYNLFPIFSVSVGRFIHQWKISARPYLSLKGCHLNKTIIHSFNIYWLAHFYFCMFSCLWVCVRVFLHGRTCTRVCIRYLFWMSRYGCRYGYKCVHIPIRVCVFAGGRTCDVILWLPVHVFESFYDSRRLLILTPNRSHITKYRSW